MSMSDTFFVSIRVPNQEFDYAKVLVDHTTTMKQLKQELAHQLYPNKPNHLHSKALVANFKDGVRLFILDDWTVSRTISNGAVDFELIYIDLL